MDINLSAPTALTVALVGASITACASLVGSCVAAFGVWKAAKTQRFNLKVQVYYQLERDFRGLADWRSSSAKILLDDHEKRVANPNTPIDLNLVLALAEVLQFLDTVGMLLRRGVIDPQLAFHGFGSRSIAYWHLARPIVEFARKHFHRPWLWNDLENALYQGTLEYLKKTDRWSPDFLTDEFAQRGLERECRARPGQV
jgi:hypothetical protein